MSVLRSKPHPLIVLRCRRGSRDHVMIVRHLASKGLLEAFARAGCAWSEVASVADLPIDFLGPLVGYAISGERTLADFFERVAPFETAFMALFGRHCLPHRASALSLPGRCRSPVFGSVPHPLRAALLRRWLDSGDHWRRLRAVWGVAPWSLTSMRRARPHGNALCPAVLICHRLNAGSMPSVLLATGGANAGRWCARAPRHAEMHTRKSGGDICRQGQWRLSRRTGKSEAPHHQLFEALRVSARSGTGPPGRSRWRCDYCRSTAAGRHP